MHWYWCYLTRVPLPGRRGPPSPAAPMDFMARKGGLPEGKAAKRWGEREAWVRSVNPGAER
jgi:hypothetical protein